MATRQKKGIHATSQEYKKYEQVNKNQNYHLAEDSKEDEFDTEFKIQTIDMEAYLNGDPEGSEKFIQSLGDAMKSIGFVILTGHGIDTRLYEQAEQKIINFFETIPEEDKNRFLAQRQGSVNQGYFPMKETTIIHPDLVEGWVFCRRAFNMESRSDFNAEKFWPDASYEKFFRKICLQHEALVLPLMRAILSYLKVDPDSFNQKLAEPNFGFRLNYYPPLEENDIESGAGRMLGHEDVDLFTLLPSQDLDGLQVLNRTNMKWVQLHAPKGSIVVNTGDYMQRISNDIFPSTTHRVSIPKSRAAQNNARISFPMAIYIREDDILEVLPGLGEPRYPPVSAIEFHTRITSKYYGDDYAVDKSLTENQ